MKNDDLSRLLIAHGNIQVSPTEARLLNGQPLTPYINIELATKPSTSGYEVLLSGYANHILDTERRQGPQESQPLESTLQSLKSMPRAPNSQKLKGSVTTFRLDNLYFTVMYQIHSGQVVVFNIEPKSKLQRARDSQERTSIYHVKKDSNGIWRANDLGIKGHVSTKYAAVNGQSNNLNKATWLMGEHLKVAYGAISEYTLFHNPSIGGAGDTWESIQDKFGLTTKVTKDFANTLEQTQSKNTETYWVAHSQGGLIFSEGTRYLLNHKSGWALNKLSLNGVQHPEKGTLLNKQFVALHGNANNDMRSRRLFERAGVTVTAIRKHDYDFVTNIIGLNTANPRKLIGSFVYANHVFSGSIPQSPHTTVQTHESWEKNMSDGPGKGRGMIQKTFNSLGIARKFVSTRINNYLK